MKTKKFVASGVVAFALAAVVFMLTVQNVAAVFDGSYANVWTAWCSNWAVAVMAVAGMFAVTTSAQRRWLKVKLVGMAGILGMAAFAFFGLAVVAYSFKHGAYGQGIFQGWITVIGAFVVFLLTAYLNRTQNEQAETEA